MTSPAANVIISSGQRALRVPRKRIASLIDFVARAEKVRITEIDVAVVSSRQISRINRLYLNHAGATDVITFDLSDSDKSAGEINGQIVVCADVAQKQARRFGHGVQKELLLYVAHGLLHLTGYDDTTSAAAKRMHARQEELLEKFLC